MSFASARRSLRGLAALVVAVLAIQPPGSAGAQVSDAAADVIPPPVLSRVEGPVHITRAARVEEALPNMPLVEGDRVASSQDGRFAIRWPDGSRLFADGRTTLDLVDAGRLRLVEGRLRIDLAAAADGLLVETSGGNIRIGGGARAEVRAIDDPSGRYGWVGVDEGEAVVTTEAGLLSVPAGSVAEARGLDGPRLLGEPYAPPRDAFGQWLAGVTESPAMDESAGASSLPEELQPYAGTLAPHGAWGTEPGYGRVWYPTVGPDWRPYSAGVWRYVGRFGWFWVGAEPWAWPTHHFGRWGFSPRGRWFWIPRRGWSPAWVVWAVGPGFVSWCPLGLDGGPVFGAPFWRGRHDPLRPWWRGWTTISARDFGSTRPVTRVAIDGRRLGEAELGAFVVQRVPPIHRPLWTARSRPQPGLAPASPPIGPSGRMPFGAAGSAGGGSSREAADRPGSGAAVTPGTWSIPRGEAVIPLGRARGTWTVPRGRQVMPVDGPLDVRTVPPGRLPVVPRSSEPSPYERARPYMSRPPAGPADPGDQAQPAARPVRRFQQPHPGRAGEGAPPPASIRLPSPVSAPESRPGPPVVAPPRATGSPSPARAPRPAGAGAASARGARPGR